MRHQIVLCAVAVSAIAAYAWAKPPTGVKSPSGPSGMIIAFAGPTAPEGWLPCDGKAVSRDQYPELFQAIGSAWGSGGDGDGPLFNLPDLRGRFLRGLDQGANRDPGREARAAIAQGGNAGDLVGSMQKGLALSHRTIPCGTRHADSCDVSDVKTDGPTGTDHEARPENVYVQWLIRQ